jgi:hypothetical protein
MIPGAKSGIHKMATFRFSSKRKMQGAPFFRQTSAGKSPQFRFFV